MAMTRRGFVGGAAALAAAPAFAKTPQEIRAVLLHWGHNMWGESLPEGVKAIKGGRICNDHVKFDDALWRKLVDRLVLRKMNTVVIDLGEFPVYPSHPELAVKGSRSPDWIRGEVRRLKGLGLEPIPKLNFSTAHDAWLGEYGRMVTTKPYYNACREIIRDAAEMFDHPRYLHIGYDEERISHQKGFQCVRTDEVWWHDFLFFVKTVEDAGMRPWMWSDYGWKHDDFPAKCPRSVVQNNWYYDEWIEGFDLSAMKPDAKSRPLVELFLKLDKAGFDQIPCGSNLVSPIREKAGVGNLDSMGRLVRYCCERISPERLKGFLMAPWAPLETEKGCLHNLEGIDLMARELEA
ncbi:MAG: hypothetical protein IKE55_06000 [Kiritimatiellae bacterium]|nr:hypothetical protein [Kiritimatiellia bacterium]